MWHPVVPVSWEPQKILAFTLTCSRLTPAGAEAVSVSAFSEAERGYNGAVPWACCDRNLNDQVKLLDMHFNKSLSLRENADATRRVPAPAPVLSGW
jgi:hypothetical protein